jgi:hypothetical protein
VNLPASRRSSLRTYTSEAPMTRAGAFTSEFMLSVLVILSATVLMLTGHLAADNWQWAVGIVTGGYALSRGIAKT